MRRAVRHFFHKAYVEGITGLSAMVAYNMLLSTLPLALLALFLAGQVLGSGDLERSVLDDLRRIFPSAAEDTLRDALDGVQRLSTEAGIAALVASIWIGASFWGALDTAFGRIYHVQPRGWVEQKRFALIMLLVVLLFMAATVAIPTLQSVLYSGTKDLPLGLDGVRDLYFVLTLLAGLVVLFGILCIIYRAVPNARVPWRAVWPGALGATIAMGVVDYAFPLYLDEVSTLARLGTTLVFITIVLLWFYALAIILLGGAVINALRYELHDTGELKVGRG